MIDFSWRRYEGDALHSITAQSSAGKITVAGEVWQRGGSGGWSVRRWRGAKPYIEPEYYKSNWNGFGLQWSTAVTHQTDGWALALPMWMNAVPVVCGTTLSLWSPIKRYYRQQNLQCLQCGYDLRATPDCCPECGAKPSQSK